MCSINKFANRQIGNNKLLSPHCRLAKRSNRTLTPNYPTFATNKLKVIDLDIEFKNNLKRFSLFNDITNDPIHTNDAGGEFCSKIFYEKFFSNWNNTIKLK